MPSAVFAIPPPSYSTLPADDERKPAAALLMHRPLLEQTPCEQLCHGMPHQVGQDPSWLIAKFSRGQTPGQTATAAETNAQQSVLLVRSKAQTASFDQNLSKGAHDSAGWILLSI